MLPPPPFAAPVTTATFPSSFFDMSFAPQPGFATPCPFRCAGRDEGCAATVVRKFARSGRTAESTSAAALDHAGRADRPRESGPSGSARRGLSDVREDADTAIRTTGLWLLSSDLRSVAIRQAM